VWLKALRPVEPQPLSCSVSLSEGARNIMPASELCVAVHHTDVPGEVSHQRIDNEIVGEAIPTNDLKMENAILQSNENNIGKENTISIFEARPVQITTQI
jgi:hypothetical protein